MDNVTRQEFDQLRADVTEIKDNHLDSIEAAILSILKDLDRLWRILGVGVAVIAVVIALVGVLA